jgi:NTE family protein/lysophospholipid hydrolase
MTTDSEAKPDATRHQQLRSALSSTPLFRSLDEAMLAELEAELTWVTLTSGETLIRQGDAGDCLYVVINGRLRVVLEQDGCEVRVFREVGRGESIGEMALLTGEKRTATVYAIRDTEVVKLSQASFDRLLERHPRAVTRSFTRAIIGNLNRQLAGEKPGVNSLTVVALLPANPAVLLAPFARRLVAALLTIGSTLHLSSERVDDVLGQPGLAQEEIEGGQGVAGARRARLVGWLGEQETRHQIIVYEADAAPTPWTRRCIRQADQILIVGHALDDPTPGEIERALLRDEGGRLRKQKTLVLLHRNGNHLPRGTQRWLAHRQVAQHLHIRWDTAADFGRLARVVAGRAVGLVLGGGGARGMAHIGVLAALHEAEIPIDIIGGTSAGALIAAQWAMGWDAPRLLEATRKLVKSNLNDYTVPLVSLVAGSTMSEKLKGLYGSTAIEDLWLPFFCVSTNLTRAAMTVHRTGPLWHAVRASNGLPGLLPPVIHNGEALVDGGLLDNLPIDIMRDLCGGGTVVAVDVTPPVEQAEIAAYGSELSGWQAAWYMFNPFARQNVPNIISMLYRTVEIGSVFDQKTLIHRGLVDLYLRPPVEEFGMVEHHAIDKIANVGYRFAKTKLAGWRASEETTR